MPSDAVADLRLGYIRALWARAQNQGAAYEDRSWQSICTSMAKLALYEGHIPDRYKVRSWVDGIGDITIEYLKEAHESGMLKLNPPAPGKFASAAAAMLVAMLNHLECEEARCAGAAPSPAPSSIRISKSQLLEKAAALSEQRFCPATTSDTTAVRCAAFQQMSTLNSLALVKKGRDQKRFPDSPECFELLAEGRRVALALRAGGETRPAAPTISGNRPRPGEATVLLLVDQRECGGQWRGETFRDFCSVLERAGAHVETRMLPAGAGDYQFILVRASGSHEELPLIVERKACEDIAMSIKDGRWDGQQASMAARNDTKFGGRAEVRYILEGVERIKPFGCACKRCSAAMDDADRPVGGCLSWGYPKLGLVQERMQQLSLTHSVVHTATLNATAKYLAGERLRLERQYVGEPAVSSSVVEASAVCNSSSVIGSAASGFRPATDAAASSGARSADGGQQSREPKRKRSQTAAEQSGKPQRSAAHLKKPEFPKDLSQDRKWPLPQSCNYAILVAMDRDSRQSGSAGTAKTYAKHPLMLLANSSAHGQLCRVDLFDDRAGKAAAAGPHGYDGWSNVHKNLIHVKPAWLALLRAFDGPREGSEGPGKRYTLTEAGRRLAARLHAEAETAGHCNCGLVAKAGHAPVTSEDDDKHGWGITPGLRAERLPTLRAMLDTSEESGSSGRARLAYETSLVEWEMAEADYRRRLGRRRRRWLRSRGVRLSRRRSVWQRARRHQAQRYRQPQW
jgi:hypothetical protein